MNTNIMYLNLLRMSRDNFSKYEEIRNLYSEDYNKFNVNDDIQNNCPWCEIGKRTNFTDVDLETACSDWCHLCINKRINLKNTTGFEPCLVGEYLDDIKDLNNFILTSSSTNEPDNPEFQSMFVQFYTTRDIADLLSKYILFRQIRII